MPHLARPAQRRRLRQEREAIESMLSDTSEWATTAINIAADPARAKRLGVSAEEYREFSRLLKDRKKAKARIARVDDLLGRIQKDGALIRQYVSATEQEIQKAIKDYQEKLSTAEKMAEGAAFIVSQAQVETARLNLPGETRSGFDQRFFRHMSREAAKSK